MADLVKQAFARAARATGINALISVAEASSSVVEGPLSGLPFVAKDNFESRDLSTTGGTPYFKNFRPGEDAAAIRLLKAAGAQLIGKANMHELGFGVTSNNGHSGPVRNPHDLSRTAGGSSGGTAAAVAAGIVPFGLATDTGGSARIPAAFCGVYGFRPTPGRYSPDGIMPISNTRDVVGVMARNVVDIQRVDGVLAAQDEVIKPVALSDLRIGVPREFFFDDLDPGVASVIEDALKSLEQGGATLIDCAVPDVGTLDEAAGFPIALFEAASQWPDYLRAKGLGSVDDLRDMLGSPDVRGLFEDIFVNAPMPKPVYDEAMTVHRPALQHAYAGVYAKHNLDALAFPTVIMTAPELGQDEVMQHNGREVPTFPTISRNTSPGSVAGIPGITLPAGFANDGLPAGLELDAQAGRDSHLLAVSEAASELFVPTVEVVG